MIISMLIHHLHILKNLLKNGLQNGDIYCFRPVTHVIFDMDGLLLNTQTMYSSVSARILAKHGKEPDFDFKVALNVDLAILSYRFQTFLQQNISIIFSNGNPSNFWAGFGFRILFLADS